MRLDVFIFWRVQLICLVLFFRRLQLQNVKASLRRVISNIARKISIVSEPCLDVLSPKVVSGQFYTPVEVNLTSIV